MNEKSPKPQLSVEEQEEEYKRQEERRFLQMNPDINDARKLNQLLVEKHSRPVTLTFHQFRRFLPLFQSQPVFKDGREQQQYEQMVVILTEDWLYLVGYYSAVTIIDNEHSNTPLLVIPPTFVAFPDTPDDQTSQEAHRFVKGNIGSDIPRFQVSALACMYENMKRGLRSEEYIAQVKAIRENSRKHFDDFMQKKIAMLRGGEITSTPASTEKTTQPVESYRPSETDWDFS